MKQARQIYNAIKDRQDLMDQVEEWRIELAMSCVDPSQQMETTSFTLNGQSGAGELRGTKADLLAICSQVIWMRDNSASLSTRTTRMDF